MLWKEGFANQFVKLRIWDFHEIFTLQSSQKILSAHKTYVWGAILAHFLGVTSPF